MYIPSLAMRLSHAISQSKFNPSTLSRHIRETSNIKFDRTVIYKITDSKTRDPRISTIKALCKALEIKVEWLLLGTGNMYESISQPLMSREKREFMENFMDILDEMLKENNVTQGNAADIQGQGNGGVDSFHKLRS